MKHRMLPTVAMIGLISTAALAATKVQWKASSSHWTGVSGIAVGNAREASVDPVVVAKLSTLGPVTMAK